MGIPWKSAVEQIYLEYVDAKLKEHTQIWTTSSLLHTKNITVDRYKSLWGI